LSATTVIDWITIDYAGAAIVEIMMATAHCSPCSAKDATFHIVNPNEISWSALLDSMKSFGLIFDTVDPEIWVKELSSQPNNPAYRLLSFYRKQFRSSHVLSNEWGTVNTVSLAPGNKKVPTVNDRLSRYVDYWKEIGFYSLKYFYLYIYVLISS
jgi:hypothetical protein